MATIGLRYPVCAPFDETTETYSAGRVIGKAIKMDISIETTDDKLYADDGVAENVKEFRSGELSTDTDDIDDASRALLFGHTLQDAQIAGDTDAKIIIAKGSDEGKPVGFGFYSTKLVRGDHKFRAIWLSKVKFGVPSESLETKGENITFQTPKLTGTILTKNDGEWKREVTVSTAAAAIKWLNEQAGITSEAPV